MESLPKEIERHLVVITDKDRVLTGYGIPKHVPMQYWSDYQDLTVEQIEALRTGDAVLKLYVSPK